MRKVFPLGLLLGFILVTGGCAQNYYAINPSKISYNASNLLEDISLYYRYDVLDARGNSKLARKEKRLKVKLVAVKVTNNTDTTINIGRNALFFSGGSKIYPLDAISLKNNIKQSLPSQLLYLLLSPLNLTLNNNDPIPIGYFLGPAISGTNIVVAGKANKNFYKELEQNDILYRDIRVGETVYGLVGFQNLDYSPLTIKLIK